ncbi:MAG TPA: M48 family metalloprotease [Terriglobales bacterium]|nr:M48 family metalloprotease [Terriglobales bacterium]
MAAFVALGTLAAGAAAPASPAQAARAATLALAKRYWYGGLFWGVMAKFWLFAILLWLASGRRAVRLRDWAERRPRGARIALFTAAAAALVFVAELPFSWYIGFVRERRFGFGVASPASWFGAWGKSFAVELAAVVIAAEIVYALLRVGSRRGQLTPWGATLRIWAPCVALMIVAVAIEPVFIAPLFNRVTPLPAGPLRSHLAAMAQQAGISPNAIFVSDRSRQSRHTNAYVVGLFGTERIVIYDTLLRAETPAEIEFVVGHEIGHYVLRHLWQGLAFGAALLLLFLWIAFRLYRRWRERLCYRDFADVAGLPFLALSLYVLFFLASPAIHGFSRHLEHQADAYGLRVAPDPCAAVRSFQADLRTDLIPPDPPSWIEWWFFNHPSDAERIAFAQSYCRAWQRRARPSAVGLGAAPASRPALQSSSQRSVKR